MDTEVMMIQSVDFDSACTTPYISAPSSPQRFGTSFFSAPTSPTRISALYEGGDIVIKSEEIDDIHDDDDDDYDFAFDFGGQSGRSSISAADELFDGGKIMPLMTPIGSPQRFKEMLPPRNKMKAFAAAMKRSKRENVQLQQKNGHIGRERSNQNYSSSSSHKPTRSLSDMRISDMLLIDHDENLDQENTDTSAATATAAEDCSDSSSSSSISSLISLWNGWNLKDLLLFRSASESRASSSTEELKKYELAKKVREVNVIKNSNSKLASKVKRKDSISAHELHYRMKREMLKEMKKKTFLPYKQGLLGCSGFDDTVAMSMSRRL